MTNTPKKNNRSGFTLLEILIVTFIIGILMGIAIPNYIISRDNANRDICRENRKTIDRWLLVYVNNESRTPEEVEELVDAGYIGSTRCPGGGTYELHLSADAREETDIYHPVPYVRCSCHGSDQETEEVEEPEPPVVEPPVVEPPVVVPEPVPVEPEPVPVPEPPPSRRRPGR